MKVLVIALAILAGATGASAIPLTLSGGSFAMSVFDVAPFSDVRVTLRDFSFIGDSLIDLFMFVDEDTVAVLQPAGTPLDFDGTVFLGPFGALTGSLIVDVLGLVPSGLPSVSAPFTVAGSLFFGAQSYEVSGVGTMRVKYSQLDYCLLNTESIVYTIEHNPVPEPSTLLFFVAGGLGLLRYRKATSCESD